MQVNNSEGSEKLEEEASHPLLMHTDYISRDLHASWNCSRSLTLLQADNTTVLLMPWKHQDSRLHCEPRLHSGGGGGKMGRNLKGGIEKQVTQEAQSFFSSTELDLNRIGSINS